MMMHPSVTLKVDEPFACLGCGKALNLFVGLDKKLWPEPGDIAVCLNCGQVQSCGQRGFCRMTKPEYELAVLELHEAVLAAKRVIAGRKLAYVWARRAGLLRFRLPPARFDCFRTKRTKDRHAVASRGLHLQEVVALGIDGRRAAVSDRGVGVCAADVVFAAIVVAIAAALLGAVMLLA